VRLVFAGTGAFAVPTLRALHAAGHDIAMVLAQPDRPAGRGLRMRASPVKEAALALGLELFQPERIRETAAIERVRHQQPQALIVAAYGQILPPELLAVPALGGINLHASLLPRHRGPAPIAWAILLGDRETGVTVMEMDAGLDTGPVLAQERVAIGPRETATELEGRLAEAGAGLMVRTLPDLETGMLKAVPQADHGATHARRLTADDGLLDPAMNAEEIDRRVRALTPDPGCWMTFPQGRLKILGGHVARERGPSDPLVIQSRDGSAYVVDTLQAPGGKSMSPDAWMRGRR
jgi:methionyl-tRNA formyltransferase